METTGPAPCLHVYAAEEEERINVFTVREEEEKINCSWKR